MKNKFQLGYILFFIVLFIGCTRGGHRDKGRTVGDKEDAPLQGDTAVVKVVRDSLPLFHSISVFDASRVEVRVGSTCCVEVDGKNVYANAQQVYVDNGCLFVRFSDHDSNYRQTRVKVMLPTITSLAVVGCGRLDVYGNKNEMGNVEILLHRVNVAFVAPVLSADKVEVSLDAVMYSQFRINCRKLNLTARHINQTKFVGHASHLSVKADEKRKIDMLGLK